MENRVVKISVRNLVEFILRAGDINVSGKGVRDTEAMQKGSKVQHRQCPQEYQRASMGNDHTVFLSAVPRKTSH